MPLPDDLGAPIAYLVLEPGTPVYASDGTQVGRVRRVLADESADIFDGLVLDVGRGPERFLDAPEAGRLYERGVVSTLTPDQIAQLPEHTASPVTERVNPDDLGAGGTGTPARPA